MSALLAVNSLTRRFGGLVAVSAVTLDLHRGEVHAVIGTNGAGKSTLINMLSGEIAASEGRITLEGDDITTRAQSRRAREGVGRSYQRTTIFPEFTVHENCRLSAQAAAPRPWAIWQASSRCAASNAAADEALSAAGLEADAHRIAGTLSHGAKRQLEVAMCLATRPRVLLLDEPLAGMGAEETERMLALLTRLKTSHAILLVEHDMDAVFRIADRITVMVNGTVIATGDPASIRNNADVRTAYLGEED
ncbi:ABC transporter ATP-binding protein [Variovorax sp. J22G21]|uniref:ABC transporter ATP-binding protein n=1 Tax=Variovorax fucosicus TaxID=3053517 RepID=UPI002574E7B6|nr:MULTISPECIES: ABC transporter ATP-binding protein [unclassified Variovorax]MDM0037759.1 ABC transporter ATP-binding protein [Variovorax sp. J22R193]MDM0062535.1 ABC transporter ATP-binding protein [Variovorax sp. J22G21]